MLLCEDRYEFREPGPISFHWTERSSLAPGLRCLVVGQHLIFYIGEPDQIAVVRVIDSRMDVEEEFKR